jgi:hypothetical protein
MSWSDMPNTPPSESIDTSTPVFPNGRVGTSIFSEFMLEALADASAETLMGTSDDPKLTAPAVLRKSLLDIVLFFSDIRHLP